MTTMASAFVCLVLPIFLGASMARVESTATGMVTTAHHSPSTVSTYGDTNTSSQENDESTNGSLNTMSTFHSSKEKALGSTSTYITTEPNNTFTQTTDEIDRTMSDDLMTATDIIAMSSGGTFPTSTFPNSTSTKSSGGTFPTSISTKSSGGTFPTSTSTKSSGGTFPTSTSNQLSTTGGDSSVHTEVTTPPVENVDSTTESADMTTRSAKVTNRPVRMATSTHSTISSRTSIPQTSQTNPSPRSSNGGKAATAVIVILLLVAVFVALYILVKQGRIRPCKRAPDYRHFGYRIATECRNLQRIASEGIYRLHSLVVGERRPMTRRQQVDIEIVRTSLRKAESPLSALRGISTLYSSMPLLSMSDDGASPSGPNACAAGISQSAGKSASMDFLEVNEMNPKIHVNRSSLKLPSADKGGPKISMQERKRFSGSPPHGSHVWSLSKPGTRSDHELPKEVGKIDKQDPIVVYVKKETQEHDTVDITLSSPDTEERVGKEPYESPKGGGRDKSRGYSLPANLTFPFLKLTSKRASMQRVSALSTGPPKPKRGKCQSECLDGTSAVFLDTKDNVNQDALERNIGHDDKVVEL